MHHSHHWCRARSVESVIDFGFDTISDAFFIGFESTGKSGLRVLGEVDDMNVGAGSFNIAVVIISRAITTITATAATTSVQ